MKDRNNQDLSVGQLIWVRARVDKIKLGELFVQLPDPKARVLEVSSRDVKRADDLCSEDIFEGFR